MITRRLLLATGTFAAVGLGACRTTTREPAAVVVSLDNARWWDGSSFTPKQGWSIDSRLTFRRPTRVDRTLDLSGTYLIPPFADAHNHGIGTGDEQRDRAMIGRYLRDGVFYMQSMGNSPLTRADRERLGLDSPSGVDAMLAQGTITGTGGHPMGLLRNAWRWTRAWTSLPTCLRKEC